LHMKTSTVPLCSGSVVNPLTRTVVDPFHSNTISRTVLPDPLVAHTTQTPPHLHGSQHPSLYQQELSMKLDHTTIIHFTKNTCSRASQETPTVHLQERVISTAQHCLRLDERINLSCPCCLSHIEVLHQPVTFRVQ